MKVIKGITIVVLVLSIIGLGFFIEDQICQMSPECICKNAQPGDITCMSPEALDKWCQEQSNQSELPQCQL